MVSKYKKVGKQIWISDRLRDLLDEKRAQIQEETKSTYLPSYDDAILRLTKLAEEPVTTH